MADKVIQEIEKFFGEQGLVETALRGHNNEKVFRYNNGRYYMISLGKKSGYYLEAAGNTEWAEKKLFEDMGHYSVPWNTVDIIDEIKSDIIKYIVKSSNNIETAELVRLLKERLQQDKAPREITQALDSVGLYITQHPSVSV